MEILNELKNNEGIFFIEINEDILAKMTYNISGNIMTILHTEVSKKLSGKGVGKKLVNNAVKYARDHAFKIHPVCPFTKSVLFLNKEKYEDLLI